MEPLTKCPVLVLAGKCDCGHQQYEHSNQVRDDGIWLECGVCDCQDFSGQPERCNAQVAVWTGTVVNDKTDTTRVYVMAACQHSHTPDEMERDANRDEDGVPLGI